MPADPDHHTNAQDASAASSAAQQLTPDPAIFQDPIAWRFHVTDSLARLETCSGSIAASVSGISASVAAQQSRVANLELYVAARQQFCPLVDAVREAVNTRLSGLETLSARDAGADSQSRRWAARLWPLIYTLAGAVAGFAVRAYETTSSLLPKR